MVSLILLTFNGCATTRFQPEGFTSQQLTESLTETRRISGNLPMGSAVKLSFYPGAMDANGQALGPEITGFFYAYNHMNDTISVSPEPLSLVNRGIPYYLDYVAQITPITPMLASRLQSVELPPGARTDKVSVVGFKQWPDFQRELLTQ